MNCTEQCFNPDFMPINQILINPSVHLYFYLSDFPSICPFPSTIPSICLSVFCSINLSVCPALSPSFSLSVLSSVCPYNHLFICLSLHPSIHLSMHPSFFLSVCLSVNPFPNPPTDAPNPGQSVINLKYCFLTPV